MHPLRHLRWLPVPGEAKSDADINCIRSIFERPNVTLLAWNRGRRSYDPAHDSPELALDLAGLDLESDHLNRDLDATEKLVLESKGLPDWARKTILGKVELERGWNARGHGWADSVSDKASAEYVERLAKADVYLEAAWKLRPDQPYAAADMILVAMDSGPASLQRARLWFDRTVKARFDYDPAYGTYTAALRPRWGGTHEEMLAFGRACAATKRYDTKVPAHLINVLEDIGQEIGERREIFLMPAIIDEVIALDKGYLAATNRPMSLESCLSDLVLDAWLCHRWEAEKPRSINCRTRS